MPVTLKDIAQRLGLSVTAVSRALNGHPDVSEATRRRVLQVARDLDYQPNALAKGLVTRRSRTVGLFLLGRSRPLFSHSFAAEVVDGLLERLGESEYEILLFSARSIDARRTSYVRLCVQRQLEAAIFLGLRTDDPDFADLSSLKIPLVSVDVPIPSESAVCVGSDHVTGARDAVAHLIGLGHRRIAMFNGHRYAPVSHERLTGYRMALAEADLPFDEELVSEGDFSEASGRQQMLQLLDRFGLGAQGEDPQRPTAVFAASDLMALGALSAAKERGLAVPTDLSVVGFDDIDRAAASDPPLTTIRQARYEVGVAAAEAALQAIEQPKRWRRRSRILLKAELVVRSSTGPAPGRALHTAAAPARASLTERG